MGYSGMEERHINPEDMTALEKTLKKMHGKLAEDMKKLGAELKDTAFGEARDILTQKEDIETLEAEDEMEEKEIHLIEEALQRMAQGTYGICLDCGEKIAIERLKALPYARYCIRCEDAREKRPYKMDGRIPD